MHLNVFWAYIMCCCLLVAVCLPARPADSPQAGGGAAHAPKCTLGLICIVAFVCGCECLQDLLTRHKQVVAQHMHLNVLWALFALLLLPVAANACRTC
jgi:hypothetical protein